MKRLYYGLATILLAFISTIPSFSQSIGIGTDAPTATLDIVSTFDLPGTRISRSLTPTAATSAALEVNDNSDWGAVDIYYANNSSGFTALYVENNTPISIGAWTTNLYLSNLTAGRFTNNGSGNGLEIAMLHDIGFGTGIYQFNEGGGNGLVLDQFSGTSAAYAMGVINYSNSQGGIVIDNTLTSAIGITNFLEEGVGVENIHFTESPGSFYADISTFSGLSSSFANVGYIANADAADGNGFYFHNDLAGGNGFGFIGFVETVTPTATPTVYGAVMYGEQTGPGHGILINHDGVSGRNAEFNISDANNTDPAIFSVHEGNGSAMVIQNQKDNITGTIAVIDAAYTGSDNDNHIGVLGVSLASLSPARGIGVQGEGGAIGVLGEGGNYGLYANGDVGASGTKSFVIDHPLDPENKILKHYALESDKVLNVYQGTVQLGRNGRAEIELPGYFQAININFSYQLTAIGTPVQPYVAREIEGNSFIVAGHPGSKVSWMVIANRNDAYVRNHPDRVRAEIDKEEDQVGKYLDPVSHGKPKTMGIYYYEKTKAIPSEVIDRPQQRASTKQELLEQKGMKAGMEAVREEQQIRMTGKPEAPSNSRMPIDPVRIRQDVKTWDEIH